jgi:hypothetical protein
VAEEAPAKEVAAVSKAPVFDPELIAAAGLKDAAEAKIQFGTPKALENAVRLMDQKSVSVAETALTLHLAQQRQQQEQTTKIPAELKLPEFKMPDPPEGEEWDEATVRLAKSLHEQSIAQLKLVHDQLDQQKKFNDDLQQERRFAETRRYVEVFDEFVTELGEDWKPLLGDKPGPQLDKQGLHLKNRVLVDQTAKQLAFGRQQQGLEPLPQKELWTRALRVAFPQKQEQVVREKVEKEVSERQKSFTARPTGRAGGKPRQGVDAAAATAEKWYRDRGMGSRAGDDFEYDEI